MSSVDPAHLEIEKASAVNGENATLPVCQQRQPVRRRVSVVLLGLFAPLAIFMSLQYSGGLWNNISTLCFGPSPGQQLAQSGGQAARSFDLSKTSIPRKEILSGGPPKDGIPSLTNPKMIAAAKATYLKPVDRVIGVVLGDQSRAYPLRILIYHEAANDRIGDQFIAVIYCPLCDSAAVFDRQTSDGVLEFGISGLLYNSNVLLYNRRNEPSNENLWSQMKMESVSGPQINQTLKTFPLELTTWSDWKSRYPKTTVLSAETGHSRNYAASPYAGYFSGLQLMFPVKPSDDRLPNKTPVLGIWTDKVSRAYPVAAFKNAKQPVELKEQLNGKHFTLLYNPDAKSLRVTSSDKGIQQMYAFWFAWYAFHPQTELFKISTNE